MIQVYKEYIPYQEAWDMAVAIDSTPRHWWEYGFAGNRFDQRQIHSETVGGLRHKFNLDIGMRESVNDGHFSYRFRRTTPHVDGCNCWECQFREKIQQPEFLEFLKQETHLTNPKLDEMFTSFYGPGDFLGRHTDDEHGVAFIFHFSLGWQPEWGGLFHIENEDRWDTYVPGFGDLVLMDLGSHGKTHFVSEVSELAVRPRIAISGWFSDV